MFVGKRKKRRITHNKKKTLTNKTYKTIQGNLLNICSDIGIKSVKVYALSGSTLAHSTCNGTETHVSMPSTMGKGIYVVSVETKQGISSRKLVVR